MAMTDEMELKARITAELVIHGRTVSGEAGPRKMALSVTDAAELASVIIELASKTHPTSR